MTATSARIRLCIRESEFATASDAAVLAARPDAKPNGSDDEAIPSFFNSTADAQIMLNERFAFQKSERGHEAAEADTPLSIGSGVAITPVLPKAKMVDVDRPLDQLMILRGMAVDFETDRNSIEADG